MAVTNQGKPAVTLWEVERRFRAASLLRVFPQTGRTHQIRVHLKSIGLPLLIDPLYNPMPCGLLLSSFKRGYRAKAGEAERPLIARLTLHAHRLSFMDLNDKPCEVEAALPKDFRAAINMLQKHG
jgi:23S rRNA-/tRNA-specific pseudouridylate synthase